MEPMRMNIPSDVDKVILQTNNKIDLNYSKYKNDQ